jgi:hypothetical protein
VRSAGKQSGGYRIWNTSKVDGDPIGSGRGNRRPVCFLTECQKTAPVRDKGWVPEPSSALRPFRTPDHSSGRKRDEIDADQ